MIDSPSQGPAAALPPSCHRDIIALWPSLTAYAADVGIPYGTAKQQRRRNSISPDHWPAVVAKAAERGLAGVTTDLLVATQQRHGAGKAVAQAVAMAGGAS